MEKNASRRNFLIALQVGRARAWCVVELEQLSRAYCEL